MLNSSAFRIAAVVGFLAVALGAFGAHGLKDVLVKNNTLEIWEKAAHYHLVHAVLLLFIASRNPLPLVSWLLIFFGVVIFSGSLYTLAFTGVRWLGAITPIGGVCLLAGWLALAIRRF